MLIFLRWLVTGDWHAHRWEIIDRRIPNPSDLVSGVRYILQCEVCGNVKQKYTGE